MLLDISFIVAKAASLLDMFYKTFMATSELLSETHGYFAAVGLEWILGTKANAGKETVRNPGCPVTEMPG